MSRLAMLIVVLSLAIVAIVLSCQSAQAQQPYARAFGFSASPYGYQWQQTAVPLPTYSGYANYIMPQTNYQLHPYYNSYYGVGGMGYTYQLPSIFQGSSGYYVPNYGW